MNSPDPLEDTDIYATVKKEGEDEPALVQSGDPDETEMNDDITDLLTKSFDKEKNRSKYVEHIP